MTTRGPTTQSLDERIDALTGEVKEVTRGLADLRADLAGRFGEIRTDLWWIKGIGATVLVTALAGSAWVIREITTVKDDVRTLQRDVAAVKTDVKAQLDRIEKALERPRP